MINPGAEMDGRAELLQVPEPLPLPDGGPAQSVVEVSDWAGFLALQDEWNAMARACQAPVFLRHEFLRIWLSRFCSDLRLRILTLRDEEGVLVGALPLVTQSGRLAGLPVAELASPTNSHSNRFDLLALDPLRASALLVEYLQADKSWDVLKIAEVPEGGAAFSLLAEATRQGLAVETWASARSPYLPLPERFEQLELSRSFRGSLRRRRRRLEERGEVTVERVGGGSELASRLVEGYALERSGWKGRRGTAIAQRGRIEAFYSELAAEASRLGWLSLYFLRLDGRAIAFDFGLTFGGRYASLKVAYDESYRELSPGQLLTEATVRDCLERKLLEVDLLGDEIPAKRDWTRQVRPHRWLYISRRSLRLDLLRLGKFQLAPRAREVLRRWRR